MANFPFQGDIPVSLQGVRDEFDRLLDRVWHGGLSTAPLDGQDWAPAIDFAETPDSYQVRVEVPGMTAEEIDVSILQNLLTIKGCKKPADTPKEGERRLRSECRFGSFHRRLELPTPVRDGDVTASCRDGVLRLVLPKKAEAKGQSVKVTS